MGYRFNTPPNWPAPPSPDWLPPEGWQADAAWGPAPDGWNFWVEDPTFAGQPSETGAAAAPTVARKNWFLRHKVITAIGAVLLIGVISNIAGGGSTKSVNIAPAAQAVAPSSTPDQAALNKAAADRAAAAKAAAAKAATDKVAAAKAAAAKAAAAKAAAQKAAAPQLGQTVRDGKFAFTVTAVTCGIAQVGTNVYLIQKAQGQYCRASMKVENIGNEAQTMFESNQYLFDTTGRKFSADSTASLYDDSAKLMFEAINPGNSINGNVYFDVPIGTKVSKLELHDSMFSGGITVRL
jgi:hypothetical protein